MGCTVLCYGCSVQAWTSGGLRAFGSCEPRACVMVCGVRVTDGWDPVVSVATSQEGRPVLRPEQRGCGTGSPEGSPPACRKARGRKGHGVGHPHAGARPWVRSESLEDDWRWLAAALGDGGRRCTGRACDAHASAELVARGVAQRVSVAACELARAEEAVSVAGDGVLQRWAGRMVRTGLRHRSSWTERWGG
jgi:hypothetical protein